MHPDLDAKAPPSVPTRRVAAAAFSRTDSLSSFRQANCSYCSISEVWTGSEPACVPLNCGCPPRAMRALVDLVPTGTSGAPSARRADCEGLTAIHLAVQAGRRDAVVTLLELGADPLITGGLVCGTALGSARIGGHEELADVLPWRQLLVPAAWRLGWSAAAELRVRRL